MKPVAGGLRAKAAASIAAKAGERQCKYECYDDYFVLLSLPPDAAV